MIKFETFQSNEIENINYYDNIYIYQDITLQREVTPFIELICQSWRNIVQYNIYNNVFIRLELSSTPQNATRREHVKIMTLKID